VTKRKSTQPPSEPPSDPSLSDEPTVVEADQPEESPKVRSAADAVARAEAELKRAQATYQTVRQEATERLQAVREKSVGDLIDGTLAAVKKHPGPGVFVAIVIGFFLGRLFRR